jgi:fibronectin-binding autotransporter adhesin
MKKSRRRLMFGLSILAAALTARRSLAASATWNGTVNSDWSDAGNWSASPVPGTGNTATFDNAGNGNTTLNLGAGLIIHSLTFDTSSAAACTIGSGGVGSQTFSVNNNGNVTLNSGVINNQTVNANVTLGTDNTGGTTLTILNNAAATVTHAGNMSPFGANYKLLKFDGTGASTVSGNILNTIWIEKYGAGSATLSGNASTFLGSIAVKNGKLTLQGTNTAVTSGTTGGWMVIGDTASQKAMLYIQDDALWTRYDLGIGANATGPGAIYQSSGTFRLLRGANTACFRLGSVASGYGYYHLSGGSVFVNEAGIGGLYNGAVGVMDITGGTFTNTGYHTIARGGTTCSGLLNVMGGTVIYCTTAGTGPLSLNYGNSAGALAILNVGGGGGPAAVTGAGGTTASGSFAGKGLNLIANNTVGTIGIANLLVNGTLTVSDVAAGGGANPTAILNFDGGTLKATSPNVGANFMTSANIDGVYVHPGGGTIDNNGTAITISRALLAPTGNGVVTISGPSTQGSGYIGAPLVSITGGTGDGATGYAVMADDGSGNGTFKVDSIVVTSPGVYTVDPTTVILTGGVATVAASGFTINTAANASGGMTYTGTGTTTVSGASTYSGGTTLSEGMLLVGADTTGGPPTSGPVGTGALTLSGGTLAASGASRTLSNPIVVTALTTNILNGDFGGANFRNLTLSGAITGSGTLQNTLVGNSCSVNFTGDLSGFTGAFDYANSESGNGAWFRFGANSTVADASQARFALNGSGTAKNLGFTDGITGSTLKMGELSGNATFQGSYNGGANAIEIGALNTSTGFSGVLGISANNMANFSVTKVGGGTLTLSGTNLYTGGTTVNGGALNLAAGGGAGTIRGALTINTGATVNLTVEDALGYTSGQVVTPINVSSGTLNNANSTNNGLISTFNLTGGSMTSTGGGAFNINASGAINSLASDTMSTISAPVILRANGLTISTDLGTAPDGIDLDISGAIWQSASGYGFTKMESGTLALSGVNTYSGNTLVKNGTLLLTGTNSGGGVVIVGNTDGTAFVTLTNSPALTAGEFVIGDRDAAMSGTPPAANGTVTMYGGNVSVATWLIVGRQGGTGTLNQAGGTVTNASQTSGLIALGWGFGIANGMGVYNLSGDAALVANSARNLAGIGATSIQIGDYTGGNGAMNLSNNASVTTANRVLLANAGSSSGTLSLNDNASFTLTGGSGSGGLAVWGGTGSIHVVGGALNANWITLGQNAGSVATLNQNGGTTTVSTLWTTFNGVGTNNLNGGVQVVGGFNKGSGTGVINFNGGTLKASSGWTLGGGNVSTANVLANGANIDDGGYSITISQALLDGGGGGGLTKTGAGTLTLSAENTFTGPHDGQRGHAGRHRRGGRRPGSTTPVIELNAAAGTFSMWAATMSQTADPISLNRRNRSRPGARRMTALTVAGTATLGGTLNVTDSSGTLAAGQAYTVIRRRAPSPATFAATNLPALSGSQAWDVSYTGGKVVLTVTGSGPTYWWDEDGVAPLGGSGDMGCLVAADGIRRSPTPRSWRGTTRRRVCQRRFSREPRVR